jgi:uncharacterized membrane protein YqhA
VTVWVAVAGVSAAPEVGATEVVVSVVDVVLVVEVLVVTGVGAAAGSSTVSMM